MNIRNKLIMMLAIPLAALALIGALGFRAQSKASLEASDSIAQDDVVQSLNRAIKALGGERLSVAESGRSVLAPVIDSRQATDDSLQEALELSQELGLADTERVVLDAIERMADVRATENILRVAPITERLRIARDNVQVVYPTQVDFARASATDIAVDIADRQDSIWLEYILGDAIDTDLARRMRAEIGATELLRNQIVEIAPDNFTNSLNQSLAGRVDNQLDRAGVDAIRLFDARSGLLEDAPTLALVSASHADWHGHAIQLQDELREGLEALGDEADDRRNLFSLVATLGLLILLGLIYVVYRSVVRPLEDLLEGAEKVASDRLPTVVSQLRTMGSSDANIRLEPLPRESNDELGSLVDAFNDVQLTAFDLAVEQARSRRNIAEMFVNLGRRNQKLLQRMLSVISELEHDEKDADKLESLFQLDHMTTRMRRNAESLLVVAGTTTPRQWSKPVPAADVVRSALAEVAEYHRIDILTLVEAPMAGNAVADITHLLAELLENSLQFSEPETRVTITSRWKDGDYHLVISDHGFGMTEDELAENNDLIANPPPPDEAPTRFLGLFVVGHLAKRHDIRVRLTDGTIGGTDARITIPAGIMSEAAPIDVTSDALPSRGNEDLDLDAELAALTESEALRQAEEDVAREQAALPDAGDNDFFTDAVADDLVTEPVVEAPEAELPVRGETELPVRGDADLPVRGDADLPVRGETAINFDEAPELPSFDETPVAPVAEQAPPAPAPAPPAPPVPAPVAAAPAPPAPPAPAPAPVVEEVPSAFSAELPVRGQTPAPVAAPLTAPAPVAAAAGSEMMGLPTRTPRATLPEPIAAAEVAVPAQASAEAEDVTTTASTVGSAFSAFQAGIQRGEATTN